MGPVKLFKRVVKHSLYLILCLGISHTFISYFVSMPELYQMMHAAPWEHAFIFCFVFGLGMILYFNFSWFREQFCIILCPYGRFQSALIDQDTVNIGYDEKRGEPRGKASDPEAGDCIDCRRCVQVCPTGIDIRQGVQMECIACAQCIDACDEIMTKLKRPTGLVRYDSERGLEGKKTRLVRPRTLIYSLLLFIGAAVLSTTLSQVRPANASVTRLTGSPYYLNDGMVRNNYMVRIDNKRSHPQTFIVRAGAETTPVEQNGLMEPVTVEAEGVVERTLVVQVPRDAYPGEFDLVVTFEEQDSDLLLKKKIRFLGPDMYGQ
jgi:cytochrome c oxidase accessory protein FixG